tara:strand:- start:878 stop:2521 length:1644 start_codon:yes stop_codon:yes gene_type:complete
MTKLILDIETTTDHNTIWLCCCEDLELERRWSFVEPEGLQQLIDSYDTIIGHNIIGFDAPVLSKVWDITVATEKLEDTMILSRLYNPELKHSLAVWGQTLGFPKGDFTDYDGGLCAEMVQYCEQDVTITKKLYKHLDRLLCSEGFSEACRELEHSIAVVTHQQELNGFRMDTQAATELYMELTSRMEQIKAILQTKFLPIVTERWSEKTGKRLKDGVEVFNMGSRPQIAKRLQSLGANFTKKTEKGTIVIDEGTLLAVKLPEATLCSEYLMLQKREGLLNGWFKHQQEDGRIRGRVITNGAVTGRMTHHSPNMAQIPATKAPYGKQCRSCFTIEQGNVLVGIDASGLELRMLAHYMRDDGYTQEILEGDVHTANMKAAGLTNRDQAKTFIYAFLYGAGPAKIGSIIGKGYKHGKTMTDKFLQNTPAIERLKDKVERHSANGLLPGLDGRVLRVRSQHAALNTLLQSAGAIVMKKALVILVDMLHNNNIEYKLVANVHDEWQIETPQHFGDAVGACGVMAIKQAGTELGLRCPLGAEYKIGLNWSETH